MIEQLNTIADLWWHWAAAMFWQVGLLIVLIAGIDRLTRRWTWPQLRYALWSLVLIKLILPPTLSLPSSVAPRLTPVVTQVLSTAADEEPARAMVPLKILSVEAVTPRAAAQMESSVLNAVSIPTIATQPSMPALDWRVYALGFWLAGSVLLATFLTLRLRSLSKTDGRASERSSLPESFYNQVSGCAGRLGLRHLPRVVATDKITCPAVFGMLRPVLLVPQGYLGCLSRRDTEHMLLHELAHVKRGDLLAHGFYMLLQIVYWYNPLLWLVRRQIHHLRELCCDATVAGLLREDTGAYRETLLETARRFLATRTEPGLGLLGLFEDSNRLLIRLNWLNKPTWRYRRMKRAIVIAIIGLMLACVLPMAHSQPTAPAEVAATPATPPTPEPFAQLPMAYSQPTARTEFEVIGEPAQPTPEQFAQQMEMLQQQMQQLQQQRQQLQQQMQQMNLQMAQLLQQRAQFAQDLRTHEVWQTYTVRLGDTLAGIAQRFPDPNGGDLKDRVAQILKANQLASADAIQAGQQLRIPLSAEQSERIRSQLAAAERRVHDMSGALVQAEHALNETEHIVASRQARIPHVAAPAMPAVPAHAGPSDLPDADRVIDVTLPERVPLVQLLDLAAECTRLAFVYDPNTITGEVTLKLNGGRQGQLKVKELYQLLESALKFKDLAMVRQGDNIVAIVPKDRTPKTDLLTISQEEGPPTPTVAAAVDADYVVKALKPGTELRIQNNVGSIKIQGGPGQDCAIKVKVEAKGATPEQAEEMAKKVLIQVTPADDVVTIGVQMPDDISKEQRETIQVHFDMTVPQDSIVRAMQNVGDIYLAGLGNSAVQARTNVGTIRTRGLQSNVALGVNVGDIDVVVPADPSVTIRASAKVGAIKSDLPLDITSASVMRAGQAQGALGSSATGVLGAGEGKLDLTTNVGSIRIHSASATPEAAVF